jgi:hypothetical protein
MSLTQRACQPLHHSITSTPRNDTCCRPRTAEHIPKVTYECFGLLVSRKVSANLVLRLEYDPCFGPDQTVDVHRPPSVDYSYRKGSDARFWQFDWLLWEEGQADRNGRLGESNLARERLLVVDPDGRCWPRMREPINRDPCEH